MTFVVVALLIMQTAFLTFAKSPPGTTVEGWYSFPHFRQISARALSYLAILDVAFCCVEVYYFNVRRLHPSGFFIYGRIVLIRLIVLLCSLKLFDLLFQVVAHHALFFRWDIQIQRSPYHPSWVFIRGNMLWVRLIVLRICFKIVCSSPLSCDTPRVFSFSLRYTNSTS